MNNINIELPTLKSKRQGVIGFLLTMAVGVALGAAALVVSNEMQKKPDPSPLQTQVPSSPLAVEKAFADYQKAHEAYRQAVGRGRPDIDKYKRAYDKARRRLELEIFRNTPGVSDMDMSKFDEKEAEDEKK
jgi:hypothetical protein